jgi:dTDP-4-dehydrorhamnose 3,5-epimerase-like enzyme
MNVIRTAISEVLIIEPEVFGDPRGFFVGTFEAAPCLRALMVAAVFMAIAPRTA